MSSLKCPEHTTRPGTSAARLSLPTSQSGQTGSAPCSSPSTHIDTSSPLLPARARDAVFLPQRLLMAACLSAWVVGLLTLCALTGASWVDAALGEALDEAAALSGQLGARATNWRSALAPSWRPLALVLGQALLLLPPPTVALIRRVLLGLLRACALLLSAASAAGWWLSARN